MNIRIDIGGKQIDPRVFAVPEMSLSSGRAILVMHEFRAVARADEVIALLSPAYDAWVKESKRDDAESGAPQDELAEAGYPSLAELLQNPALSRLVICGYLIDDFLGKVTWDGASDIEFWFDDATAFEVKGGLVEVTGICYGKR